MFKSIKYIKDISYNETTKLHSYEFEITDSSFVVICKGAGAGVGVGAGAWAGAGVGVGAGVGAVISEYSKRNLNVAANLLKFFLYYEKLYGTKHCSINIQIKWCEKYQPLFTEKLKKELEKYLVLL